MTWPPNYVKEFNRRLVNRNKGKNDPIVRRAMQLWYADHPIEWINDWCVTFDPRAKDDRPRLMPFCLFPRQEDFILFLLSCLNDKEDGLVEKARDMGATWLCCAFSVWLWLYHDGSVIGWGSRKESYVDKMGDPKAIFPKIRQILEHLPPWMLPDGFNLRIHATYMRIVNPVNGSAIIGEAGDSMGRGGRSTIYFKDESAHYERPELVEAALGDNTDVQIDMSSVNGSANPFYRRRMAGEVWYKDRVPTPNRVRVFLLHWSDNPMKSQEWWDERRAKAEAEGMLHVFNQEVNCDYAGSVEHIIIKPEWIRAAVDAHLKLGIKAQGLKIAGQDVADGGGDKNALAIMHGIVLRFCDIWGGEADAAAFVSVPICIELGVDELYYESTGVGAGFKGGINSIKARGGLPTRLKVYPWNPSGSPLDKDEPCIQGDMESPTNDEQYKNLKAQGYFRMRARFYKTWRAVIHGDSFPPEELISLDSRIPRLQELIMELAQPVHKLSTNGKTMVDKAPNGASSPNMADAINIAANRAHETSILDVVF